MNSERTPDLNPTADKYIDTLIKVTGMQNAMEILHTAQAAARPLTDAERERVCRSACRLAGILLDAARMARQMDEENAGIRAAEEAADELIHAVNRLNGWEDDGEEEAE